MAKISVKKFRVSEGEKHCLRRATSIDTIYRDEADYDSLLQDKRTQLSDLQELLYADDRSSLLVIFQGMDTSGKDSAIKHVMSGVNPQGCQVSSFKRPSLEELDHDFLWRASRGLPERGRIGIFNRSYYEEVLVPRVHPSVLEGQKLPPHALRGDVFANRMRDIRHFETYLARQGTRVVKFFMHISKDEQRRRLLKRIDDPAKNWKFDPADLDERARWRDYQHAFADALSATSTRSAPWYVIPADDKKNARLIISSVITEALHEMDLHWPRVTAEQKRSLAKARRTLR